MIDFADTMKRANELGAMACRKAREQRSIDVQAGREYANAAELVEGKPKTLALCVRNSIECFMRAQDWIAADATIERWTDDARTAGALRMWMWERRTICHAKIREAA